MKKVLVSSIVVAGIAVLGGGAYLWPKSDHVSSTQSAVSSSVVTSKTSHKTAKQVATKDSESVATSESKASSSREAAESASKESSATSKSAATTSAASTTSSATANSASETASTTTSNRNLTSSQVIDWVWTQVAQQYQGASVTKSDFNFQQYQRSGLAYVDVYENSTTAAQHLAGRFRIDAQGNLEQQSLSNGSTWRVVSSSPSN